MAGSLFDNEDPVAAEVDRRIRELKLDPDELLQRFDRNGDGVLDAEEWRVVRDTLQREVENNIGADEGETIEGRYRLISALGRGTQGQTHLAVDEESGEFVAVKEVDFANATGWDVVDMFEREAAVLGGLNHPAIPRMLETIRVDDADEVRLFMVQEFIEGETLETRLRDGELFDERMLLRYAHELLDVLTYLHRHTPPVVHRDIKPANIIVRPDGHLALVDFGAAQGARPDRQVIGTSGYMAPEQLMGHAVAASDVYGLGATLIHLATRTHPSELTDGVNLDWRERANLSETFERWLDKAVSAMPEARFPAAMSAKTALSRAEKGATALAERPDSLPKRATAAVPADLVRRTPRTHQLEKTSSGWIIRAPHPLFQTHSIVFFWLIVAGVVVEVTGAEGPIPWQFFAAIGGVLIAFVAGVSVFRPVRAIELHPRKLIVHKALGRIDEIDAKRIQGIAVAESRVGRNHSYAVSYSSAGVKRSLTSTADPEAAYWLDEVLNWWLANRSAL